MLVLLGLFVLETLASFIGPGNYKSVKQLDADINGTTRLCEDSEVRSSDINGNDEVEDRGNTGIHWIARQPTQHETEKLIENLDRFDASPDSKEYCLKEAEKMLRLADVGKDRCLFYATETHGFLATEWANASEMVTVETCARHGGLFRGRYEFSWDKKLLPFSKMQGNEIVIRNWFRATSTIFATLCKGTAYLVYDGDWTESRGDGGRASIWRTDEYNALINNDGIERIVQLGETPVRKIIDALDIKYLKEMATRQQYEITLTVDPSATMGPKGSFYNTTLPPMKTTTMSQVLSFKGVQRKLPMESDNRVKASTKLLHEQYEPHRRQRDTEQGPSRLKRWWKNTWAFEILTWAIATIATLAIFVLLAVFKDKPLRDYHSRVHINTFVSVLAQVGQTAAIVPVSECIGQLKWLWYKQKERPIKDFQDYDAASRGPYGSIVLLVRNRGLGLVSLGALLTILNLAFAAFAQQAVTTAFRETLNLDATIQGSDWYQDIGGEQTVGNPEDSEGTSFFTISSPMKVAVLNVLYGNNDDYSTVPASCPTNNCTWSPFTALGVVASVDDVTPSIVAKCPTKYSEGNGSPDPSGESCNYTVAALDGKIPTLGSGSFNAEEARLWLGASTPTNKTYIFGTPSGPADDTQEALFNDQHNTLTEFYVIYYSAAPDAVNRKPGSFESRLVALKGTLSLCLNTYESSFVNGTTVTTRVAQGGKDPSEWTFGTRTHDDKKYSAVTTANNGSTFAMEQRALESFRWYFADSLFTGSANNFDSVSSALSETTDSAQALWRVIHGADVEVDVGKGTERLQSFLDDMAISMSNALRQAPNSTTAPIKGTSYKDEAYISVTLYWLILPLALDFLLLVLLVATIFQSRAAKLPIWKTSQIAVLLGLSPDLSWDFGAVAATRSGGVAGIDEQARAWHVKLKQVGDDTAAIDNEDSTSELTMGEKSRGGFSGEWRLKFLRTLPPIVQPVLLKKFFFKTSSMSTSPVKITERTSSKKKTKEEEIQVLKQRKSDLERETTDLDKRVKTQPSYDQDFWQNTSIVKRKRSQMKSIDADIARRESNDEAWDDSTAAKDYQATIRAHRTEAAIAERQEQRMKSGSLGERSNGRAFFEVWISSPLGWDLRVTKPKRWGVKQTLLREESIELYNSRHPDESRHFFWCPVLGEFRPDIKAAHIFPHRCGENLMRGIFGVEELMHPHNIIIMSTAAKDLFDKGIIAFVPAVRVTSRAEIELWNNSEPKKYRLKIMDKESKEVKTKPLCTSSETTWLELDGKAIEWNQLHKDQIDKSYWGTGGEWLNNSLLRPFAEEMGHEFEAALGYNATGEEGADTAISAAVTAILTNDPDDEDDEDDEGNEDRES
ncbi:MAG: hypothetical protein M1828_005455 [Chrysothrix sp. TS-e1954]|nr:MAG: hypothetical protein M1828_005455 [Chrysothrix sp. TS-e1954]